MKKYLWNSEVKGLDPELAREVEGFIQEEILAHNGAAEDDEELSAWEHKVWTDCDLSWAVYSDGTLTVALSPNSGTYRFSWEVDGEFMNGNVFDYFSGEVRDEYGFEDASSETSGDNRLPKELLSRAMLLFYGPDASVEDLTDLIEKDPSLLPTISRHPNWPDWILDWTPWLDK